MRKEDGRVRSRKPSHVAASRKRDKEEVVVAVIHRENRRRRIQCGECLSRSTAQPVLDVVEVQVKNVEVKIPSAPITTICILQEFYCFGTSVITCYLEGHGTKYL